MLPLYVSTPPGLIGFGGECWIMAVAGVVVNGQVTLAMLTIGPPLQTSLPDAARVAVTAQALSGTMKLPVKLVPVPGARVPANKTVPGAGRSLVTTTLVSATLPVFVTVPL